MNLTDTGSRFELVENGLTVFADYRREGAAVALTHIEADPSLRGTGAAGRLMDGIVARARADGFSIKPRCPYAREWFERHPEDADLLA